MICPNCQYQLQKLEVMTNNGGKFAVDHCGRCGGTWFDPYEVNRIPYQEVARLANLTVLPKTPIIHAWELLCPRCHTKLGKFHAESLPRGVRMYRCRKCLGIWAGQKALEEFKIKQIETVKTFQTLAKPFPALSLVFMPAVLVAFLIVSTLITLNQLTVSRDNRTNAGTLINQVSITNITSTSILLYFPSRGKSKSLIVYRDPNYNYRTQIISNKYGETHQIILSGLQANTFYYYYLRLEDAAGKTYTTSEAVFKTLPEVK